MGGFRKLQLDNTHFGQSENGREEEAPEPTQQVKAVLTHPFSISTGLPEVPYCNETSTPESYVTICGTICTHTGGGFDLFRFWHAFNHVASGEQLNFQSELATKRCGNKTHNV